MDVYTTALTLLSRRELSTRQLRDRLRRLKFDPDEIDEVLRRLTREGALDDKRVALSSARMAAAVKRRGPRRVLRQVRQLGISDDAAKAAVEEVFSEVDEVTLLDEAMARRLKGADPSTLDRKQAGSVVRSLVGQGFRASDVYARLRRRRTKGDE